MKKYILVREFDEVDFQNKVEKYLNDGYEFAGQLTTSIFTEQNTMGVMYCQGLIKEEKTVGLMKFIVGEDKQEIKQKDLQKNINVLKEIKIQETMIRTLSAVEYGILIDTISILEDIKQQLPK